MNQLVFSSDLKEITAEIIAHKGMLAQNVFEIGARLKHVRDAEMVHGQWEKWCGEDCGISPGNARKYIRVFDRFSNRSLVTDLGMKKMDMLTEFTDEELQTPALLPSGEEKKLIDMSQKEIEQYKKAQKEAEQRAAKLESELERANTEKYHFQKLAQREPQVKIETRTVEVVPTHIKKDMEDKDFQIKNLRSGYQEAKEKLQQYELRQTTDFDAEEAQRQRDKLLHDAEMTTMNLRLAYKQFIEKASISSFMQGAIATASNAEKERLAEMVESAEQIINQTKSALRGRKLGVVNE